MLSGLLFAGPASANQLIGALKWGDSPETVERTLKTMCSGMRKIEVAKPSFPLAKAREVHVICYGLSLPTGKIDQAAFTLSDDKLNYIQAQGGVMKALVRTSDEKPRSYLNLKVFRQAQLFIDEARDTAWFLSKEALHPNLFAWHNPYFASAREYTTSAEAPVFLIFGEQYEKLEPLFKLGCPILNIEHQDKPWLPTKPSSQFQVNCFGYELAGFPRKIEAIFGDGRLEMAWILTGAAEEHRVRAALTKSYGAPTLVNENWDIFSGMKVALRKDKPEILMISERLIPYFKERFTSGSDK